jgi:FkbH-like protein
VKLIEALEVVKRADAKQAPCKSFVLACGFTALHLRIFLKAHLQIRIPNERVEVVTGLYGDLAGTIERACAEPNDGLAAVVEWADLDSRLGVRQLGGWQPQRFAEILSNVTTSLERLEAGLMRLAMSSSVALALPTLALLPLDLPAGWQNGAFELELQQILASFALRISHIGAVHVLNSKRLDFLSPLSGRHDVKSELASGFPYHLDHADKLADFLAALLITPAPKKGLITDLDDTCWKGVLGEVGVDGVSWELDGHGQIHGIYQQFLHALSERGVLVGIASKNDPTLVHAALRHPDIHLPADSVFPIEASWRPKSESVTRILKAWNISADTVAYIDNSPMELAEVKAAHPELECILFPEHAGAVIKLLDRLRDLFGKPSLSEEDRIRSASLRNTTVFEGAEPNSSNSYEEVLRQAGARIYFRVTTHGDDLRALELLNKTNQFNLNGRRYSDTEWRNYFRQHGAVLLTAAYRDKFGPLGEIATVLGRKLTDRCLIVDAWVMSCRAFSRRIEHRCLQYMFQQFGLTTIVFDWVKTPRNEPLCEFLGIFGTLCPQFCLSREQFDAVCPALFHFVEASVDE